MDERDNREQKDGTPITRRELARRAGAAALGLAAVGWAEQHPALAHSREAESYDPIILGNGTNRYECRHDWLVPPDNILWGDTQGVAQDGRGRIYIAHTSQANSPSGDTIVVFDEDGKYLYSWGERFKGGAHGLDLRKEDGVEYLYICDTKSRLVVKTTLQGKVVWEKGVPQEAGVYKEGMPFIPTNIAFAPDGGFYVADGYGSNFVHQYDKAANYVRTFGGKGKDPGQLAQPHGLWLDTRGKEPLLVVADRANNRLQYFTPDGKHVRFDSAGMRRPCHFSLRGDLMLVPDLASVVTLLDDKNKVVVQLGDGDPTDLRGKPRSQYIPGKFIHPHSAKFLRNGDILVVEWVPTGRVTLLKKMA
jgi:DNA-binding beta-propeller fold protein YncE